eukprot:CAMPEP_0206478038 /NCGR_PEP_ID=MMETSP0324_2-20121206/35798_1 /ASSEMBLY_ACC=CAM_ASM_000836 /TAXON_ID=2866 /ORGANISM="Crypthecodinium cohnii, Strain Seligo" /LENGTH=96 /DNA_ID=CAMNT_0053954233 /DNA_START=260 /DNA_END=550 /DNA_ORIENTATION=+
MMRPFSVVDGAILVAALNCAVEIPDFRLHREFLEERCEGILHLDRDGLGSLEVGPAYDAELSREAAVIGKRPSQHYVVRLQVLVHDALAVHVLNAR